MANHLEPAGPPTIDPEYDEYDEEPGWRDIVMAWEWKPLGERRMRKSGKCPRCGHPMVVDARSGPVANLLPSRTVRQVLARCHCSANHDGHPDSEMRDWGCGYRTKIPAPQGQ